VTSSRPFVCLLALLPACSSSAHSATVGDAGHHADAHIVADAHAESRPKETGTADAGKTTACTLSAPSPPDWHLVTDGPLLKDGLGRIVFLRGVDAGGRSKFAPYVPFDYPDAGYASSLDAYMAHAEAWGIDAMRVPFTWAALEPTRTNPPSYNTAWLAQYSALLTSAWQHGIYTIVDFHQDVYSEVFCGDGFPAWTLPDGGVDAGPPAHDCPQWQAEYFTDSSVRVAFDAFWPTASAARAAYVQAWDEMISEVGATPGVIGFEPINEPAAGTATLATFEQTTLTSFYTAIATEMNEKAPTALVFFDGTELDGVTVSTSIEKPEGNNLVFAPHFYPLGVPSPDKVQSLLSTWSAYTTTWGVPVWVGEFGASNASTGTLAYMQSIFQAFDALPLVGGTEWEYSESIDLWNSETDTVATPDGGEYPVAQALIRPFARAVAGTAISQSYDVGTLVYTLAYTATDGITEIRSPARAYPAGESVTVQGGCYDASSTPGEVLVKASAGANVKMTISPAVK
jgi:endoglycosylceramidase